MYKKLMHLIFICACLVLFFQACTNEKAIEHKTEQAPHIVFISGNEPLGSDESLEIIAQILDSIYKWDVTILNKETLSSEIPYPDQIPNLEILRQADLAVFFIDKCRLHESSLNQIADFVASGKPVMGIRSSLHAFNYPKEDSLSSWNDGFAIQLFGQKYTTDNGEKTSTDVRIIEGAKDHAIMRGILPKFSSNSFLYNVTPLRGECRPLIKGQSRKVNRGRKSYYHGKKSTQPVAWTKMFKNKQMIDTRTFYTSMGTPLDFQLEPFRKMLINAFFWLLNQEEDIPPSGKEAPILNPT